MKRFILIVLSALVLFLFSACNSSNEDKKQNDGFIPTIEEGVDELPLVPLD